MTDEDRFLQNLYKSVHSSNVVDMSRTKWDDATTTANEVASVIDNTWNAVKRDIVAGVNESVEISCGNVRMGPNATISWGQISNQPYIPVLPSYIQQTKIAAA
ncbi:hypothetical protein [Fontibacillus panacisegetis]|uniref:hypothetical protein n=1 Tax=Fontibacillus panacisegetis TaxID=670482 RepID=UPI000B8916E9|nr:hypothetical protein [Fontibacillus panacisegetis]